MFFYVGIDQRLREVMYRLGIIVGKCDLIIGVLMFKRIISQLQFVLWVKIGIGVYYMLK